MAALRPMARRAALVRLQSPACESAAALYSAFGHHHHAARAGGDREITRRWTRPVVASVWRVSTRLAVEGFHAAPGLRARGRRRRVELDHEGGPHGRVRVLA